MSRSDDLTPTSSGVKLTYDDFVQFPDDGQRHELVDGEHYVTPSPNPKHRRVLLHLSLMIGNASPGTRRRDETIKRRLYERAGVDEYRVVDPELDVVRGYRRSGERFERPTELSREGGDVLTTPLLPGLEMSLERIFRD